jgi:hypothetical protein
MATRGSKAAQEIGPGRPGTPATRPAPRSGNTARKLLYLPDALAARIKALAEDRRQTNTKPASMNAIILEALEYGLPVLQPGAKTTSQRRPSAPVRPAASHPGADLQLQDQNTLRRQVRDLRHVVERLAARLETVEASTREERTVREVVPATLTSDDPVPPSSPQPASAPTGSADDIAGCDRGEPRTPQAEGRRIRTLVFRMLRDKNRAYRLSRIREMLAERNELVARKFLDTVLNHRLPGPHQMLDRSGERQQTLWSHNPNYRLEEDLPGPNEGITGHQSSGPTNDARDDQEPASRGR